MRKYVFLAFNYPTLCRAMKYIDTKIGKDNATIIFTDGVSPLPEQIARDYSVVEVHKDKPASKNWLFEVYTEKKNSLVAYRAVEAAVKKYTEATVVVFKDNEMREVLVIDRCKRRFGKKVRFWLIEEGFGIYAQAGYPRSHLWIQKAVYGIMGIPWYALTRNPQGLHPMLEKIICARPALLEKKYKGRSVAIEQQIEIFDKDLSNYFIKSILQDEENIKTADFVFLTTPISEMEYKQSNIEERNDALLKKLLPLLAEKGNVLIKKHPRDKADYTQYEMERVKVCEAKYNKIPFECIHGALGYPMVFSLNSSAGINLSGGRPSVYLYKLLGINMMDNCMTEDFERECNVVDCESYEQLYKLLENHK